MVSNAYGSAVLAFKLARYRAPRKLRLDFLGVDIKPYATCFQMTFDSCACLVLFDSDSWC
jgi:hypothetical protein